MAIPLTRPQRNHVAPYLLKVFKLLNYIEEDEQLNNTSTTWHMFSPLSCTKVWVYPIFMVH